MAMESAAFGFAVAAGCSLKLSCVQYQIKPSEQPSERPFKQAINIARNHGNPPNETENPSNKTEPTRTQIARKLATRSLRTRHNAQTTMAGMI
tara:strand:+ start:930 stop:1208 length:279 start_codon:yes stop_codon:yes gene_type:complete